MFFKNTEICVLFLTDARKVPKNVPKNGAFLQKSAYFAVKKRAKIHQNRLKCP
jgi:hypothetical protein